ATTCLVFVGGRVTALVGDRGQATEGVVGARLKRPVGIGRAGQLASGVVGVRRDVVQLVCLGQLVTAEVTREVHRGSVVVGLAGDVVQGIVRVAGPFGEAGEVLEHLVVVSV